jgi:hypothetical protein
MDKENIYLNLIKNPISIKEFLNNLRRYKILDEWEQIDEDGKVFFITFN